MAILSVNEHHAGRKGSHTANGAKQYVRQFLVITDTVNTSPDTVRVASDGSTTIPVMHTGTYPGNPKARVVRIDPSPIGDQRKVWMVKVTYSTSRQMPAQQDRTKPWNKDAHLSWSSYTVTRAVEKDKDNAAVENAAGDRFDPPLQKEVHYPVLTIVRYERAYKIATALAYIDRVNSAAMSIGGLAISAEQAKITKIDGVNVEVDGVKCWQVTYEIMFASTWQEEVLEQGFYYLDSNNGNKRTRFKDEADASKDSVEPRLLKANGAPLPTGSSPVFKTVKIYSRKNFGPLGLPA